MVEMTVEVIISRCFTWTNSCQILQVSPPCHEDGVVNYEVELIAAQSDERFVFINRRDVKNSTVTLKSPDIKMNEIYECYVRIEGVSNSESMRMNLSKLC